MDSLPKEERNGPCWTAQVASERSQRFQDQVLEVLVEGPNPKKEGEMMGRSRHNKLVFFEGGPELRSVMCPSGAAVAVHSACVTSACGCRRICLESRG